LEQEQETFLSNIEEEGEERMAPVTTPILWRQGVQRVVSNPLLWGVLALICFIPPNWAEEDPNSQANTSGDHDEDLEEGILVKCSKLLMGQFRCTEEIDPKTQQLKDCRNSNVAKVTCEAVDGLLCEETSNRTFHKEFPCKWTNGYRYDVALLLSVFLGYLGADRLYLGHLGMAALKFSTLGFFFIGHLIDIILIATQYTKPIDGSHYVVGYYGPSVESIRSDNLTYVVRRPDWYT